MSKGSILIVDDEEGIRRSLKCFLELEDYHCLTASNGREAIRIVKEGEVKFVISDIRMPEGDGIELLNAIKEYSSGIPIVLLMTGFAEIEKSDAIELGALDLISKPLDMDKILEHVNSFM